MLFARYAYPPNELGYCGPPGAAALVTGFDPVDVERRARQFEGAWCYLEMLAEACGVADPLDERVVRAYWTGGPELDVVDSAALVDRLEERFRGQVGGTWRLAAERAIAHHSFQVFEVYPWVGLLVGPASDTALSVLQKCRIRVGEVTGVDGESVEVLSHPLVGPGPEIGRGPARSERARWSVDGESLIEQPEPGDLVALHWDWVCEVISPDQAAQVHRLEDQHLLRIRQSHDGGPAPQAREPAGDR